MQVSTRTADYLVDVIALRSHIGPHLAPMFADTKVSALQSLLAQCHACYWSTTCKFLYDIVLRLHICEGIPGEPQQLLPALSSKIA